MLEKTKGYTLLVSAEYSEVDYREAEKLERTIEEKYGISVRFPSCTDGRHRQDIHRINIPLKNFDLLDDVIRMLGEKRYLIKGIERLLRD